MTPEEIEKLPYRKNVGVMLINAKGHVWVGQRIDRHGQAPAWQMPQGGIDKGEKAQTAALRELEEETGVTSDLVEVITQTDDYLSYELPHDLIPKLWKGKYRGQKQKWFLMRFKGQESQIDINTQHPEFSEWKWLPATELVANIVPFKRDVYARILSQFESSF
ncbi:MAG: RNA pyrophosphohydrolase [Pseudomonadota bacterium]